MSDPSVGAPQPFRKGLFSRVLEVSLGVTFGFTLAGLAGPKAVSLWYQPLSGDAFSCAGSVREALAKFVALQLTCAAVGGVGAAAGLFFLRRALRRRAEAKAERAAV